MRAVFQGENSLNKHEIGEMLPEFLAAFLGSDDIRRWGRQRWELSANKPDYTSTSEKRKFEKLSMSRWNEHFEGQVKNVKGGTRYGSLGVCLKTGNRTQWICIDCDTEKTTKDARERLIPELKRRGFEVLYEFGGTDNDRCHVWIAVRASIAKAKKFINDLFAHCKLDIGEFEVFPTHKENFIIRVPGGIHLKTMKVHPIEFRGELIADSIGIMSAFIQAKPLSEEEMMATLTGSKYEAPAAPISIQRGRPATTTDRPSEENRFLAQNLDLPPQVADMPKALKKVASNCRAFRGLLTDTIHNGVIDEPGQKAHDAGLWLAGMAQFIKQYHPNSGADVWMRDFFEQCRTRDFELHNWFHPSNTYSQKCSTIKTKYKMCGECPYRFREEFNPCMFLHDELLIERTPEPDSEKILVSHEYVRTNLFPELRQLISEKLGIGVGH